MLKKIVKVLGLLLVSALILVSIGYNLLQIKDNYVNGLLQRGVQIGQTNLLFQINKSIENGGTVEIPKMDAQGKIIEGSHTLLLQTDAN